MTHFSIIVRMTTINKMINLKPRITEKTLQQAEKHCYTFTCGDQIKKSHLTNIMKTRYKVKPLSVRKHHHKGIVKKRGKHSFTTADYWVYIVEMPKETKISGFEATK